MLLFSCTATFLWPKPRLGSSPVQNQFVFGLNYTCQFRNNKKKNKKLLSNCNMPKSIEILVSKIHCQMQQIRFSIPWFVLPLHNSSWHLLSQQKLRYHSGAQSISVYTNQKCRDCSWSLCVLTNGYSQFKLSAPLGLYCSGLLVWTCWHLQWKENQRKDAQEALSGINFFL